MVQYLCRRFREQGWLDADQLADSKATLGFIMRVDTNTVGDGDVKPQYVAEPPAAGDVLQAIAERIHLNVLMTMSSDITSFVFQQLNEADTEVKLHPHNITVPVVESLEVLAIDNGSGITRRDFCCLVRRERVVLVWSHTGEDIMMKVSDVESKLMGGIWGAAITEAPSRLPEDSPYRHSHPDQQGFNLSELPRGHRQARSRASLASRADTFVTSRADSDEKNLAIVDNIDLSAEDDKEALSSPTRPFLLTHSVMVGLAVCLLLVIQSLDVRLIIEIHALGKDALPRLGLLATLPIFMWFTIFFSLVVVGTAFQLVGPIGDVRYGNNRHYSSRAPDRRNHPDMQWPHITIQMPVYKEGLKGVIIPTINSVMAAIRHYEGLGGTASLYVCEDGMQALKPEVAEMRKQFYRVNNIGWCARPAHGKDGFVRAGKFKKASNMNYCLSFSSRVEDELLRLLAVKSQREGRPQEDFSVEEEETLYQEAMETILEKDEGQTMADGNVRMGEIILIIDCDTRVVSKHVIYFLPRTSMSAKLLIVLYSL